jgi:hypothetical protein
MRAIRRTDGARVAGLPCAAIQVMTIVFAAGSRDTQHKQGTMRERDHSSVKMSASSWSADCAIERRAKTRDRMVALQFDVP